MEPFVGYIDPGSGSLVVQALIAGLVAIPVFFRHHIARAVRTLRGDGDRASASPQEHDDRAADG